MLERGLFVTDDRLEELMDPSMPLVKSWMRTPVVVGIDPARTKDSTVVTVMYVDWNNVDEFGYMEHRILNWLEINNEEWEEQYFRIIEFLAPYRVYAVGVDAQGVGGAVAERIAKLLPNCEVQSLNSDAKSQSERWTHMQALIQRGLFVIPGHSKARRTRVWKRFFQQMTDAEKIYRGPYMLVAAPEEAEAHDDYVDSAALACAMSAIEVMPQVEETSNPMYSRSR
jgi:hypothetical protein